MHLVLLCLSTPLAVLYYLALFVWWPAFFVVSSLGFCLEGADAALWLWRSRSRQTPPLSLRCLVLGMHSLGALLLLTSPLLSMVSVMRIQATISSSHHPALGQASFLLFLLATYRLMNMLSSLRETFRRRAFHRDYLTAVPNQLRRALHLRTDDPHDPWHGLVLDTAQHAHGLIHHQTIVFAPRGESTICGVYVLILALADLLQDYSLHLVTLHIHQCGPTLAVRWTIRARDNSVHSPPPLPSRYLTHDYRARSSGLP